MGWFSIVLIRWNHAVMGPTTGINSSSSYWGYLPRPYQAFDIFWHMKTMIYPRNGAFPCVIIVYYSLPEGNHVKCPFFPTQPCLSPPFPVQRSRRRHRQLPHRFPALRRWPRWLDGAIGGHQPCVLVPGGLLDGLRWGLLGWLPSGSVSHNYGTSPCYSWENPLQIFKWWFSIVMLNYQRVLIVSRCGSFFRKFPSSV